MVKSVWGIKITPRKEKANYGAGFHGMHFSFEFALGKPGALFFTAPELASFVVEHPKLQNTQMGYWRYRIHNRRKLIEPLRVYPFGNLYNANPKQPHTELQREALKVIEGKKIGARLEGMAASHLVKRYPGFAYKEALIAMGPRRKQNARRRIKPGQEMPIAEFRKKIMRGMGRRRPK